MKRFLEVEVSRRQTTAVILAVDDEDPKWAEALDRDRHKLWDAVSPHVAEAVGKTVSRLDWETNDYSFRPEEAEVEAVREIPEREARLYETFAVPCSPPAPAEVRAAAEQAGQGVLALPEPKGRGKRKVGV